jgi:energy-coupling factor transporter ATP-binding protein EcfA2
MRIKYQNVGFSYGATEALRNVGCEIQSGRTVLVVGHNGSGKSTFLKMTNGILKPTNGTVYIGGTSTKDRSTSDLARLCALSFQNPDDQLFARTVEKELRFGIDNIRAGCSLLQLIIDTFQLSSHLNSNPYSLPYALRRLVAVAGSAAMDTPVVALDEPTAGLSIREKGYLSELLSLLKSLGKTLVVVTHDLNFLLPFADDLLMLSHGEIQFFGRRDELFERKDGRELMRRSAISYPVYARLSAALEIGHVCFEASAIIESLPKK